VRRAGKLPALALRVAAPADRLLQAMDRLSRGPGIRCGVPRTEPHGTAKDRDSALALEYAELSIVSWNVENVARLRAAPQDLAAWHDRLGSPDVLCLQELRVRDQDAQAVADLRRGIPGWAGAFSLNRDERNVTFRGGRAYGVGTWTRNDLDAQSFRPEWDREGRVLVSILPAWKLVVVNVYAVNGTAKPYYDHDHGRFVGDRHAFKRRFITQLGELVRDLQNEAPVILIGDWNVSQTAQDTYPRLRTEEPHALARREFAEGFVAQLRLADVFRHRHPRAHQYTWFNPRARYRPDAARVDFALISESLLPRVVDVSIDEADAAFKAVSDHVPVRVSLRSSPEKTP